ncbi:MAG TPA: hypothetical protein VIW01_03240 [Dehalococcoidia bacterium]
MPRRKRRRRQRLERQEHREDAKAAGVPVAEEVATPPASRTAEAGVSYSGAAGGLLGSGMFFAAAMGIVIDPSDESRLWAIPSLFIGLCFLPAIWVSVVRDHPRRKRVLRITTVGVMGIAMVSLLTPLGLSLAVLLAPPTALLAIGAGFIFQRSGSGA